MRRVADYFCSICNKDVGFWYRNGSVATDELEMNVRSRLLLHQLKHAVYFEPIWRCIDCPFSTPWKNQLLNHIKTRKECVFVENRIEELYQLSDTKIEGRRAHFRCCKCDWSKTSRSDEAFSAHLLEHVREEQKSYTQQRCHWSSYHGGNVCNISFDELFAKWIKCSDGKTYQRTKTKERDEFLRIHGKLHELNENRELMIENLKFFRKIGYNYQCTICCVRFFKDSGNTDTIKLVNTYILLL